METQVRNLFERYQRSFAMALCGDVDLDEATSFYAHAFVAASPAGVISGTNDDELKRALDRGYAHYRAIGTREMRIRDIGITPIDEHHCVARVAWTGVYERKERPDVAIDFDVHYLVQKLGEAPLIFGWISGDEREILEKHGIG